MKRLKDIIITKKFYWKIRHLISPKVWESYFEDSLTKRRDFYSSYIIDKNFQNIFEFGCASWPNLFNIDQNVPWNIFYFGYDISSKAIKFAQKNSPKDSHFFSTKISPKIINLKLNTWKIKNLILQFMIEFYIF